MANNPKKMTIFNKVSDGQLETLVGGGTITKGDDTFTADEGTIYLTPEVVDSTPTANSTNTVTSGGVKTYVDDAIASAIIDIGGNLETFTILSTDWTNIGSNTYIAIGTELDVNTQQNIRTQIGRDGYSTIASDLLASNLYTDCVILTLANTLDTDTVVELINNNPTLFTQYGFQIASVVGQNIMLVSVDKPSETIEIGIKVGG